VQQAAVIVFVLAGDLVPAVVARFGPFPTGPRQIAAEGGRVEIPLVVGQRVVLGKPAQVQVVADRPASFDESSDQLVTTRVVIRRRCDRDAVVGGCQAEPEIPL
jgi:hypothetical protein